MLRCSWGLLENVAGAPFHRSFLWGRGKVRGEDVLTALSCMKALPRSPLFWPTRPLLLRFIPPAMINRKSITAHIVLGKYMKNEQIDSCLHVDWFISPCSPFRWCARRHRTVTAVMQHVRSTLKKHLLKDRNVHVASGHTFKKKKEKNPLFVLMLSPWLTFLFSFLLSLCLLGRDSGLFHQR